MKIISRYLNVPLCTALSLMALANAPAHAATGPDIYFYPSASWDIERSLVIADDETGAQCTLKNTFNNGFTLTFSSVEDKISGLSVDLSQDILTPNDAYDVALQVPGATPAPLKAMAQSASTLNINLSEHSPLYETLKQSSVLDLKIDENNFRFYMIGFAEAAKKFSTCAQTTTAKSPEEVPEASDENEKSAAHDLIERPEGTHVKSTFKVKKQRAQGHFDFTDQDENTPEDMSTTDIMAEDSMVDDVIPQSMVREDLTREKSAPVQITTFEEAERQVRRLGEQIRKERAKCALEKEELETMLFNPNLTETAQIAKLAELEEALAAAQRRIRELEARR